jgi:hypothetical protein
VRGRFQRILPRQRMPAMTRWGYSVCVTALIGLACEGGVKSAALQVGDGRDALERGT